MEKRDKRKIQDVTCLTVRESEILSLIQQGYTNKMIAAKLNISDQTVKNHITKMLAKSGDNDRTGIAITALKQELQQVKELLALATNYTAHKQDCLYWRHKLCSCGWSQVKERLEDALEREEAC